MAQWLRTNDMITMLSVRIRLVHLVLLHFFSPTMANLNYNTLNCPLTNPSLENPYSEFCWSHTKCLSILERIFESNTSIPFSLLNESCTNSTELKVVSLSRVFRGSLRDDTSSDHTVYEPMHWKFFHVVISTNKN